MQQLNAMAEGADTTIQRSLWIMLVIVGSIGFSFALACATPFAALATLSVLNTPRRDLLMLVGLSWLANQIIGYGFLGYPQTWDGFAWGAAIGMAAFLAAASANGAASLSRGGGSVAVIGSAFTVAFMVYELALLAASFVLPGSADAFSAPVVWRIFYVNVMALAGLLVVHRFAMAVGLVAKGARNRMAAT